MTDSTTSTFRIIRDANNKDGWIVQDLASAKVGFIKNLNDYITELSPGQLWEGETLEERDRYSIINLVSIIRP